MTVTVVSTAPDGSEINESGMGDTRRECPDCGRERDCFFDYFERRRHLVAEGEGRGRAVGRGKFRDRPTNKHHPKFNPKSRTIPIYSTNYFLSDCSSVVDPFCDVGRFPIPRFFQSSCSISPLQARQPSVPSQPPTHAYRFMRQPR